MFLVMYLRIFWRYNFSQPIFIIMTFIRCAIHMAHMESLDIILSQTRFCNLIFFQLRFFIFLHDKMFLNIAVYTARIVLFCWDGLNLSKHFWTTMSVCFDKSLLSILGN